MQRNPRVYPVVAILIAPALASIITIFASITGKVEINPIQIIIAIPSILLFLVSAYKVYFSRKDALVWTTIALVSISLVYLLYIGLILVADSSALGAQNIISRLIPAIVIFVGIWTGIHRSIKNILATVDSSQPVANAVSMKSLALVIVVMAILPTILIDFYFTPQENETFIQTSITDNLAGAMEYSVSRQNNFTGYQPTLLNEAPKCSGPLIENISPDGTQVAVFGRSCTNPAVYYCSTLAFSMAFLGGDNNFGQSMQTIPAQFVSAQKYDCSTASTSPVSVMPIVQTQSVPTFPAFGPFTDDQLKALISALISDNKKFNAAKGTYSGSCIGNSFNAADIRTAVDARIPIGAQCDANSDAESVQLSNGTWWCQDTSGFAGTIKYGVTTTLCSQSDAFHEKYSSQFTN